MNTQRKPFSPHAVIPIVLFCFFVSSAVFVILLGARVYESTVNQSNHNYAARTMIAYITEKVHHADTTGSIRLDTFDGNDALVLVSSGDSAAVTTYIYAYEGNLCELSVLEGSGATAAAGTAILPAQSFTISACTDQLLSVTCIDENGHRAQAYIALHANQEAS